MSLVNGTPGRVALLADPRLSRVVNAGSAFALVTLGVLVYARVGEYGYAVMDDPLYITANARVRQGMSWENFLWALQTTYFLNWHPLTWLSYLVDTEMFGADPRPRHLVNLLLHLGNGFLVYLLSRRLLGKGLIAWFPAFLFVVHPLHVESVVWLSERKGILCALFYFSAVWLYLRYVGAPSLRAYLPVLVCLLCALMSKPMAVSLPVVFLLLDVFVLDRLHGRHVLDAFRFSTYRQSHMTVVTEKIPLFLLVVVSMYVTIAAQGTALIPTQDFSIGQRLMNAAVSYLIYLKDIFLPIHLAVFYPRQEWEFFDDLLPAALVLLAIAVTAFRMRQRSPLVALGITWFFVSLIPVIGIVQVGEQSHADRYMYIPALGIYWIIAHALRSGIARWGGTVRLLGFGMIVYLAGLAWIQVGYWSSQSLLWTRAAELNGPARAIEVGLFEANRLEQRLDKAELHARRLVRYWPEDYAGYSAMGVIEKQRGRPARAERWLARALALNPEDARLVNHLADVVRRQGREKEALGLYRIAAGLNPNLIQARLDPTRNRSAVSEQRGQE